MLKEYPSRYPLVFMGVGLALGNYLQSQIECPPVFLLLSFFLLIFLLFLFQRSTAFPAILIGLFFIVGQLSILFWKKSMLDHPIVSFFPVEHINVMAKLHDPPENNRRTGVLVVEKIYIGSDTLELGKKFIYTFPVDFPQMVPENRLYFHNVSLTHLKRRRNPGQFDFFANYRRNGIIGEIISHEMSEIRLFSASHRFSGYRLLFNIRQTINRRLFDLLEAPMAGFMTAILLGYKQDISSEVKRDFQRGGVAHVIAISGLHVGFIVFILSTLLSFFPISFRWQHVMIIFFLMVYMLLSGANPPVVRATLMVTVHLLGVTLQRKPEMMNTLFLAGLIFLLLRPQDLFSVSFQFSFVAVWSILFFYRRFTALGKWFLGMIPEGRFYKTFIFRMVQLFFVSLAAQIGTIPLTIIYFKQLPLVALVLNLPVIPLIGIIIPIGFMMLGLSWIHSDMAYSVGQILTLLIKILFQLVHLAANFPGACLHILSFDWMAFLIYVCTILLGFSFTSSHLPPLRTPIVVTIIFLLLWKIAPTPHHPQLLMLDVGQGESTLLITPAAKNVLFDAGPTSNNWDSGLEIIYPALQELGILRLHKVILSHPHSDHIGGIFSLLATIPIDSVYLPEVQIDYFWQDSLLKAMRNHKVPYRFVQLGDVINLDSFTKIYFLGPWTWQLKPADQSGKSINNTSLVALVKMKETSILFTGDTESDIEKNLLQWNTLLKVDILKVGHHGSRTSSSLEFLQKVQPQMALIPVGQNNKFDHPSAETLKRLKDLQIPFYRTDLQGAIFLKWDYPYWRWVDWD